MTKRQKKRHLKKVADKKNRIKQFGEVFTPTPLVNEILDKLPKDTWHYNKTFIDPSCGDGQFLAEVVRRKLKKGHAALQVLFTTYGVELQSKNTVECRNRILELLVAADDYGEINKVFYKKALKYTIVTKDSLSFLNGNGIENFISRCHDIEIKVAWGIALTEGFRENRIIVSMHLLTA